MTNTTLNQLRVNQLRKQHFLVNGQKNFYEITESQLGFHSTDYWTPYLSVWARIGNYNAQEMFQALNSGDRLVRANAFRGTVFVIHVNNLAMILAATGPRLYNYIRRDPNLKDINDQKLETMIDTIQNAVEDKPLKNRELKEAVPELEHILRSLIFLAMAKGKVIRAFASHAKSKQIAYASVSKWIPELKLDLFTHTEALSQLVHRYIKLFGPVSEEDIVWWLDLPKTTIRTLLKELTSVILTYEINGIPHYLEQEDFENAKSLEPLPEPIISFLPYEDHFPKAFINRAWFLGEKNRSKLFPRSVKSYWPSQPSTKPQTAHKGPNQSGEIRPSIWLNDQIIGRWE
ncbi:MAG: DNA glycosylase AlkZ-like family protein, partial [Candidatus Hodarchaeota archaeon]